MSERDAEQYLRRDDLGGTLRVRATRGVALTLGAQWARFVLQVGSTAVLARLLTPADYGLVGMVLALTVLAELVKDLGLSAATVQRKEITHQEVSNLFWINAGFGLVLSLLAIAASPLIAAFYGRDELVAITIALSASFLFGGLAVQHQALILRRMRFGAVGLIEVIATAGAAGAAILAASQDAGYWALVVFYLVLPFLRMTGFWVASPWRPSRYERATPVKPMITFGGNVSVFNILNYLARNLDNVLIGRFRGPTELGLYNRAYQLLLLPLQQINQPVANVAIPTLSFLQDDHPRYRSYYRTAVSAIAFVAMPLVVLLAALSNEIVRVLLGDQWLESARIFQVLAFAGLAQTVANTNGWIYVSTGRTGRMAVWALISRPIVMASFVIGLPWGAYGVAVSYTICSLLLVVPSFAVAAHGSPIDLADIGRATWRAITLSAATFVVARALREILSDAGPFPTLLACGVAGAATYAAAAWCWPGARAQVTSLVQLVHSSLRGRQVAVTSPEVTEA